MKCYLCEQEITRDMTDINGRILMIPVMKPGHSMYEAAYICHDCENESDNRADWDIVHGMEVNPD